MGSAEYFQPAKQDALLVQAEPYRIKLTYFKQGDQTG